MKRPAPILATLAALLLAVGFYFLLYSPRNDDLEAVRQETAALESQRASLRNELVRLREVEANQVEFRADLARLEEHIPVGGEEQIVAVRQFQEAADAAGLEIVSMSFSRAHLDPDAPPTGTPETAVAQIPVDMVIEGGYFQIVDFLRRLEVDTPRALLFTNLTTSEGQDGFPQLQSSWSGRLFAIMPTPSIAPEAPPAPVEGTDEPVPAEAEPAEAEQP